MSKQIKTHNTETVMDIKSVTQTSYSDTTWKVEFKTDRTSEIIGLHVKFDMASQLHEWQDKAPSAPADAFIDWCGFTALELYTIKNHLRH